MSPRITYTQVEDVFCEFPYIPSIKKTRMKYKIEYTFLIIGIIALLFLKAPLTFHNNMIPCLLLASSAIGYLVFLFFRRRHITVPTKILIFRILLVYGIILFILSSIMICVKHFKVGFAEYDIWFVDLFLSLFSYSMLRYFNKGGKQDRR
ncbi:positive regulator of sigma E activity [Microbacter margulisiae]|uniref:Positive regulator of sigma E activity n=1 Tax=Microbacter margulisiae TaxID=1350067 RepID=A0A7W5DR99_9PORP|nr:positive regulator of sigma E activity [Microbacter margulisiae]